MRLYRSGEIRVQSARAKAENTAEHLTEQLRQQDAELDSKNQDCGVDANVRNTSGCGFGKIRHDAQGQSVRWDPEERPNSFPNEGKAGKDRWHIVLRGVPFDLLARWSANMHPQGSPRLSFRAWWFGAAPGPHRKCVPWSRSRHGCPSHSLLAHGYRVSGAPWVCVHVMLVAFSLWWQPDEPERAHIPLGHVHVELERAVQLRNVLREVKNAVDQLSRAWQ